MNSYQLAHSPDDPQRIRVASVFELFSACSLSVCSLLVGKFSNFVVQYKAAVVRITDLFIIVQYSTVHYSTVQYSTIQYSTVQYITVQYSI